MDKQLAEKLLHVRTKKKPIMPIFDELVDAQLIIANADEKKKKNSSDWQVYTRRWNVLLPIYCSILAHTPAESFPKLSSRIL